MNEWNQLKMTINSYQLKIFKLIYESWNRTLKSVKNKDSKKKWKHIFFKKNEKGI